MPPTSPVIWEDEELIVYKTIKQPVGECYTVSDKRTKESVCITKARFNLIVYAVNQQWRTKKKAT